MLTLHKSPHSQGSSTRSTLLRTIVTCTLALALIHLYRQRRGLGRISRRGWRLVDQSPPYVDVSLKHGVVHPPVLLISNNFFFFKYKNTHNVGDNEDRFVVPHLGSGE